MHRPEFFRFRNGTKAQLPFSDSEYQERLKALRQIMERLDLRVCIFTSMHNVAYFSGFLYCAFGRPYALVVTADASVTISANIDGGQPWRRCFGDNLVYTDWQRDNFWRAVVHLTGTGGRVGIEHDHLTLTGAQKLEAFVAPKERVDIASPVMQQRLVKSAQEHTLIRAAANIADIGGQAMRDVIRPGQRELDIVLAGRAALDLAIAEQFPHSEIRDSWAWLQAGINTDGGHNPTTTAQLKMGDGLSLNTFPMISGYYAALERTFWMGEPDAASLRIWEANVAAHELGLRLIKPGATCSGICHEINAFFAAHDLLAYRSFGYGHSFGILSHYYGREEGLELREDVDTELVPGMVVSMEPMLTVPEGTPGAGGYREHDILIVTADGADNITKTPYGPEHNILFA